MTWIKQFLRWLFVPTYVELPDACKPVYEELEKKVIQTEEDKKIFVEAVEKESDENLESAKEYAETLLISSPNTSNVQEVESYIGSSDWLLGVSDLEVKPIPKTTDNIVFFDPKDNIKLDEAKATQIKKVRKPRKKNGNK